MKTRPLFIDAGTQQRIAEVIKYAEEHRHNAHDVQRLMAHPEQCAGTNEHHVALIPVGFKVVYSIEQQPVGWCRHISISVGEKLRGPHEEVVRLICKEFGFVNDFTRNYTFLEEDSPVCAVNVVERLDGKPMR